ncbi:MAG: type I-C CRISPR-associated protein Cas8c/Csd1, partial [Oscillospiraceae bacterium]
MLLQALVRYYEILADDKDCDIPAPGFGIAKISYCLNISAAGELVRVIPMKIPDAKGKKQVAQQMSVPEQVKRTVGIDPNFLCDNSSYVLGFDNKGKPKRSKDCFSSFRKLHELVLADTDCPEAKAVLTFLKNWDTEKAVENPLFSDYLNEFYSGANFIFRLDGETPFIHQNSMIKKSWMKYRASLSEGGTVRQCLVTGEKTVIARLHPGIMGIRGGQSMGNSLVSFNASAYESYGNKDSQGLNAPVGRYAAFAYATVLNRMLADNAHKLAFGDSTLIFWAESPQSDLFQDIFSLTFDPDEIECIGTDKQKFIRKSAAVDNIKSVFQRISQGEKISSDFHINENIKFYVLALSPNAARISVRFFLYDSFGNFMKRLEEHYVNLAIEKQHDNNRDSISMWKLLNETVAPSSKDKAASPILAGAVLRSILSGAPYPAALFNSVMIRIRAEKNISYIKAAIIKAYLIKINKDKKYKEVLTMSLNPESNCKPYVLGRLFAALEKAQTDANPGINTTIKDRYFTSACANPSVAFPVLLKLSNHHISKAEYGRNIEMKINEIL